MNKLLISALVLVAGFAMSPLLQAADSTPAETRPADPDYDAGMKATASGNWKAAIDSFNRVASREPKDADVQNHLGYAWRKSGNLDLAFKHYNEALRLDPKHKGAHEYIGEAYLMANNLPKAEEHLSRLDKLCFFSCDEYRDLKKAVEQFKTAQQGTQKTRP